MSAGATVPVAERARRIHHEIAQLAVLIVIAGGEPGEETPHPERQRGRGEAP